MWKLRLQLFITLTLLNELKSDRLKKIQKKIHDCWFWTIQKLFYFFTCIFLMRWHSGFLEHWNSKKSVCNIWQRFSCLLDEGIPKICKKLNSHDGFLSYLQNSTANSAHLAAHFCPALVCPQKATVRIQFLPYFWNPLIK